MDRPQNARKATEADDEKAATAAGTAADDEKQHFLMLSAVMPRSRPHPAAAVSAAVNASSEADGDSPRSAAGSLGGAGAGNYFAAVVCAKGQ